MDKMTDFKILNTADLPALEAEVKKLFGLNAGWAVQGFGVEDIGSSQFWASLVKFAAPDSEVLKALRADIATLAADIKTQSDAIAALDPSAQGANLAQIRATIVANTGVIAAKSAELKAKAGS